MCADSPVTSGVDGPWPLPGYGIFRYGIPIRSTQGAPHPTGGFSPGRTRSLAGMTATQPENNSPCAACGQVRWPWTARFGDNAPMQVTIKTPEQIEKMRVAGRMVAEVLQMIGEHVRPGVSTEDLDALCHRYIVDRLGAVPANVGYRGFPKATCISVNNVICHGIPSPAKVLKDGDIVNIDVTVIKDGWHGDHSRMFYAGEPGVMARRLVEVTREAMLRGIRVVRPGATLGDVGHAIQSYAEAERFSVVREYCGHGIGQIYHEDLQVLHYGQPGTGLRLQEGMTF